MVDNIVSILTLGIGFISLCMTIHKSISNGQKECSKAINELKLELTELRGDLKDYVTHDQCHKKRDDCPCVKQMNELKNKKICNTSLDAR